MHAGSVVSARPGRQRLSQPKAAGWLQSAPPGQQASSIRAVSSASLRGEHALMCALMGSSAMGRAGAYEPLRTASADPVLR